MHSIDPCGIVDDGLKFECLEIITCCLSSHSELRGFLTTHIGVPYKKSHSRQAPNGMNSSFSSKKKKKKKKKKKQSIFCGH
jgi:hypothetical protein